MTELSGLDWETCLLPATSVPEVEAHARREVGAVPYSVRVFAGCDWFAHAMISTVSPRQMLAHLDLDLADAVSLIVSRDNSCRYCYAVQRTLLRIQGFDDARIAELEALVDSAAGTGPTAAALRLARRVSRSAPLPDESTLAAAREAGLSADEIREICIIVAATVLANRANTIVAVPPQDWEGLPQRWFFRPVRPLIRLLMQPKRRHATPGTTPDYDGPHAYLVQALDGLPAAAVMAETLHRAWASTTLPDRSKALIFAVIAHGLQCPLSLECARGVLRREGLTKADIEAALAHLSGPALSDIEAAIVPFARETIWYHSPAEVQRRAAELRACVGDAVFIEAVAFYALANMVCRLGIVTRVTE